MMIAGNEASEDHGLAARQRERRRQVEVQSCACAKMLGKPLGSIWIGLLSSSSSSIVSFSIPITQIHP